MPHCGRSLNSNYVARLQCACVHVPLWLTFSVHLFHTTGKVSSIQLRMICQKSFEPRVCRSSNAVESRASVRFFVCEGSKHAYYLVNGVRFLQKLLTSLHIDVSRVEASIVGWPLPCMTILISLLDFICLSSCISLHWPKLQSRIVAALQYFLSRTCSVNALMSDHTKFSTLWDSQTSVWNENLLITAVDTW